MSEWQPARFADLERLSTIHQPTEQDRVHAELVWARVAGKAVTVRYILNNFRELQLVQMFQEAGCDAQHLYDIHPDDARKYDLCMFPAICNHMLEID